MDKELRILILEDVPTDAELAERELNRVGIRFSSKRVETKEGFIQALKDFSPGIILSDYKLPTFDGMAALSITKEMAPTLPFILVTGSMNEETAVECMKAGASDYVIKDHLARLGPAVKGALENKKVREEKARLEEALWTAAREWRATFDAANYPIALMDLEGKILRCNKAMANLLGKPFSEIIGRNCCEFMHDRPDPIEGCPVERLWESSRRETLRYAKGERWFDIVADPLLDENGRLIGAVHIMIDITDRKLAREALEKSEERFRLAAESSTDLIYEWDLKERVDWFGKIDELLGYAPSEFPRTLEAWTNSVHPDDRNRVMAAVKNHLEKSEPYNIEYRVRKKDSTYSYWWGRGAAARDEKGNPYRWVGAITDITERKRAEEALRASENKYRILIENVPQKIFLKDKDCIYISCNENYAQDLKIKPNEISGRTDYDFYPKEFTEKYRADDKRIMEAGKTEELEEKYVQDGREIWVNTIKTPVKDEEGNLVGILGIFWDITERKKVEEALKQTEEQLRQSQKMEAIGQLAGGIAHDFNNLLTVIKGYSQLSLLGLKEGAPLRGNLEVIENAADKAAGLTRQILAFSRRQILEQKVLDLNIVLQNLEEMLRRVIGEDIELMIHLPEGLGRVKSDPGQIEQVIMNLAVNAKDAMPEGGKLVIETANVDLDEEYARNHVAVTPGRYVMLSVSDTGVGMTPEVKEKVFDPFFTTKNRGEGTGLGLSTVYGIVKQSGGHIWVYSEVGKGTTLKIYLPRVDEPVDEIRKEGGVTEGLPRGSETILVVEDEEVVRKLTVRILQEQGYRVLEGGQGIDALLIDGEYEGQIHLLVTDVVMPKLSGRELAERLSSIRPGIKVLYMSGYTDNVIAHHGILDKGMNFVQKPFTVEGLARKVREVLDK
jgi:PAS domain S-box-containing protein